MKSRSLVFEIARWEFQRWFKWKDQFVTLAVSLGVGLTIWGGVALLADDKGTVNVSVVGHDIIPLNMLTTNRIEFSAAEPAEVDQLRKAVGRGDLDGLLMINSLDMAELVVYKEPFWTDELGQRLTEARTQLKIQEMQIPPGQLSEALQPFRLGVSIHPGGLASSSTSEKVAAGVVVGLMLLGIFVGMAYQFVSITGEKQSRVTEMVVSAVSTQQWMDGKIAGLSAYALAATITNAVAIIIFVIVSTYFGSGWVIPLGVANPLLIISLMLLGLAGFLFWNTVFASIAATVNDPNTSARSAFIFLPALPLAFAFFTLGNPDSLAMKILSLVPITSSGVLPARLVLTEVGWWEVPAALLILAVSIWFFRTLSGKVFRLGMLMHGKEPSFKEMLRWARET